MKKYFLYISCAFTLAIAMSGCKRELEDYYLNPDKTSSPTIEKLFSGMMNNNRVRPQYWDLRTFQFFMLGKYCQIVGFQNDPTVYQQTESYVQDRWNDYYSPGDQGNDPNSAGSGSGPMGTYRTMERLYKALPIDERPNMEVFMMAGKVLLLDQTAQMVDIWGDIPFSEAGSLDATSTISNPKFDSQVEVYDSVLVGLKNVADWFQAAALNTVATAAFANQDFVMHGSMDKWRRYINSLRLRYALRISYYDEAKALQTINEIFGNEARYPLVDGNGVGDNYNPVNTDVLLFQLTNYTNNLNSAFTEKQNQMAPDYMLNTMMVPNNDPRIPFLFDKWGQTDPDSKTFTPNPTYKAVSAQALGTVQSDSINYYAFVDSTTFRFNSKLPGIMMTAAETNFMKAEIAERWGVGGDPEVNYNLAVRQAIAFVNYLHSTNSTQYEPLTQPSTAAVTAFLANPAIAYTGTQDEKLDKIWTQKWISYAYLQCGQAWAEYRRTKSPKITIWQSSSSLYPIPPTRLTYPDSEKNYNTKYQDVKDKDNRTTKIFWDVKE